MSRLHGHLWTVGPHARSLVRPPRAPDATRWRGEVEDPARGAIALSGLLTPGSDPTVVVVLVHGLGGLPEADYMRRAAAAVHRAGASSLRLALRGADRSGRDYYHAGLTADLHAALASPALAACERIFVVGFSLGGHMALRAATEPALDGRVVAVCAVCPPLDLAACQRHIDRARLDLYRRHVLRGLKDIYAGVARLGPVPTPVARARRIRTLLEWDEEIVAPRHGFGGAADYYDKMAVGPRLGALRRPALVVATEHDPMVPTVSSRPFLGAPHVTARVSPRGGHVGFPRDVDLGLGAARGLMRQVLDWFGLPPLKM